MARRDLRHPAGVDGPWFVDDRCIDCDAARQVAPDLIARNPGDGVSVFTRQPETDEEVAMAWRAVLVCPTRSVGHETIRQPPPGVFPHDLGDNVHRLGHNAESSFGAHSYLVVRDGANVMVDAPRWTRQLIDPIEALGGIDLVLLTHRDDVADADRYAEPVEFTAGVTGFPDRGHGPCEGPHSLGATIESRDASREPRTWAGDGRSCPARSDAAGRVELAPGRVGTGGGESRGSPPRREPARARSGSSFHQHCSAACGKGRGPRLVRLSVAWLAAGRRSGRAGSGPPAVAAGPSASGVRHEDAGWWRCRERKAAGGPSLSSF